MKHRINGTTPSWVFGAAIIIGYAFFRSANSSIYLSQFSQSPESFIFMTDPAFNITSALATVVCSIAVVALCALGKLGRFSMPVIPAALILVCGMAAPVIDETLPIPDDAALAFSVIAFSVGSIMLKMAWIELIALESPRHAIIQIACASLASAGLQYVLAVFEASWAIALTTILLVSSVALLAVARRYFRNHKECPAVRNIAHDAQNSRRAIGEMSDALLTLCVLEAVIGLINSFMLAASMTFSGAASVPSIAMVIAAGLFFFATLIARRLPAASAAFRVAFPVLAAMVVFVPFASDGYSRLFSTMLLVGYDFVALLVLYQVAYASSKFNVSSYALMALFSGSTKLCLLAALIIGSLFGGQETQGAPSTVRFLVLSCGVIYLLSMGVMLLSRDRKKRTKRSGQSTQDALEPEPFANAAVSQRIAQESAEDENRHGARAAASIAGTDRRQQDEPDSDEERRRFETESETDSFDETCRALAEQHGLTEREMEVLGHLARGRTNTRIAEDLFISPSTVRGHIRHIYTKLDVHDRQELIDLFQ